MINDADGDDPEALEFGVEVEGEELAGLLGALAGMMGGEEASEEDMEVLEGMEGVQTFTEEDLASLDALMEGAEPVGWGEMMGMMGGA
jgi:hypothetical protein